MRRHVAWFLVVVNLALAGLLASLWVTPEGQLRNVAWQAPSPIRPDLTQPAGVPEWSADLSQFIATLDRPLFAVTRKPPAKPEEPVADTLGDVRLLGLYTSAGGGGAILRAEGKVRRTRAGDSVGGWTVKEIRAREIVLARGDETRSIELKRGPDEGASAGATVSAPGNAGGVAAGAQQRAQQMEQENREKLARINALRARIGMPPLP